MIRAIGLAMACLCAAAAPASALERRGAAAPALVGADQFSPGFLGMYRKVLEIAPQIDRYSRKHGVDPLLARAVCMFESGGNGGVVSHAGARGYFQVMPSTFRSLHVSSNIEAGIKYLGQLVRQFGREDYALAAYNGGPGRVAHARPMPLESLQYVMGISYYRSVLQVYGRSVHAHAAALGLATARRGDSWADLSARLDVPVLQLKLFNPFVSASSLARQEYLIAYPRQPWATLLYPAPEGGLRYRARIGDNYFNLAAAFSVDVDRLRAANGLWRLQVLPAGMVMTIPDAAARPAVVAAELVAGGAAPPTAPDPVWHRVRRGENLTVIARRYGTSVAALRAANRLGARAALAVGRRLRIPAPR